MNVKREFLRVLVVVAVAALSAGWLAPTAACGQEHQGKSAAKLKTNHVSRMAPSASKQVLQNNAGRTVGNLGWQNGPSVQAQTLQSRIQQGLKLEIQDRAAQMAHQTVSNHGRQVAAHQVLQTTQPSVRMARLAYLRSNPTHCWNRVKWCGHYPVFCHWWYDYCGPLYYFDPTCSISYDWWYYFGREATWHLGLKCVLIPGMGLGVESVQTGSPADLAGVAPGMIITHANGIPMIDEMSMPRAIRMGRGLLHLTVLTAADGAPLDIQVHMRRLVALSY